MAGAEARQTVTDPISCFQVMHRLIGALAVHRLLVWLRMHRAWSWTGPPQDLPAASWEQARQSGGNLEGTSV